MNFLTSLGLVQPFPEKPHNFREAPDGWRKGGGIGGATTHVGKSEGVGVRMSASLAICGEPGGSETSLSSGPILLLVGLSVGRRSIEEIIAM